jgi:hypothetical protein
MKDRYLEILKSKEKEAELNYKTAVKAYFQTKSIKAAATRERIAFEEGMRK